MKIKKILGFSFAMLAMVAVPIKADEGAIEDTKIIKVTDGIGYVVQHEGLENEHYHVVRYNSDGTYSVEFEVSYSSPEEIAIAEAIELPAVSNPADSTEEVESSEGVSVDDNLLNEITDISTEDVVEDTAQVPATEEFSITTVLVILGAAVGLVFMTIVKTFANMKPVKKRTQRNKSEWS